MGIAVSSWRLARAVSRAGQLGVISGTAIERIVACRLQEGDPGGHVRRALDAFPDRGLARSVHTAWFQEQGLPGPGIYRHVPMYSHKPNLQLQILTVVCAFVEVFLAKEGHQGPVGINLLEKIQAPTLPVLYGALLAGVDVVLMGAGIPRDLPNQVDALLQHQPVIQKLSLGDGSHLELPFDVPALGLGGLVLQRPRLIAIISSDVLAQSLVRSGGFDGFVVESWEAGGHNAPPRGSRGIEDQPVYGERDQPNLERIRQFGVPFWLAGRRASADGLREALALGAQGVQVGTVFAFCHESGMDGTLRLRALRAIREDRARIVTEGRASPTGFPFKVLHLEGTEGGRASDDPRQRQPCVMGYLRHPVRQEDGTVIWRCAAEPESDWVRKGGKPEDARGRRCICQGLTATAGHAHAMRDGGIELPLITAGDDLAAVLAILGDREDYTAQDVLAALSGMAITSTPE